MEGPAYPDVLRAAGLDYRVPDPETRERIDGIIFDELVNGRFTPDALAFFQTAIAALAREGCDAVVLGCTEIPLLVPPEASPLPTLDSTRLLARAAVERALA
jgi:aspartate racemase